MTRSKNSTSTSATGTAKPTKKRKTTKKQALSIPSPTHWTLVEDNHIPLDTLLLLALSYNEGKIVTLGYRSSITNTWIEVNGLSLEEEGVVVAYNIITDPFGRVLPYTSTD